MTVTGIEILYLNKPTPFDKIQQLGEVAEWLKALPC
jgi:hypothetical protein